MQSKTNELKKRVFFEMIEMAGRAFVVARYSENVIIGTRGFTEEEKKNGIVLVFNAKMNFSWDDRGIASTLVFGTSPQKCIIPADDIVAVYSPELNAQFISSPPSPAESPYTGDESGEDAAQDEEAKSKVVKVDFSKKRARRRTRALRNAEGILRES